MSWKEWKLVLHFPLPLAVVAETTIAAVVAPHLYLNRLLITWILILFGLVMAAYSFDALASDWKHLIHGIKQWQLVLLALIGVSGFIGICIYAIITTSITGIVVAIILLIFVLCYNLEVPKWFHNKYGFSISWGSFVCVSSYYYQSLKLDLIMIPLAIFGFLIAMQEWHQTNTKSPAQQAINNLSRELPERKILRKQTFIMTSYMCYSLFLLSITLLFWKII
jgi:hypothetical protein